MKPAKPSKKRAGTAPRRRASISKVPPASPAVVAPALFGAAAAPAPQTDAAAAGGGTVLPLIHNGVAAPAPAMQGDTLHPSPPPASRRAPSRSGTRSRARPRSRAAVAVVTISAASQAPAFPPPPMAFELSAAGATQSTPLSAVAAATIPLPASPGAAGGAAVPSPRAARAVLHAAVTVGTALAAMSPQHAGGGGAFPLSSSPPGAPGAAAPQPSPSAVAAAAASSPAAASAEPLVPSPPPPHRPASAARRINRSPRPSVPGGASKAKGKGGGATTAAAAAATAVAAKSAPVAGAGALFKLLSLSDVVDVVMGKAPEGRRTMPNLIDLSINPSLQLPDLVCNTRQTPGVTRTGALYVAAGSTLFSFAPDGAELPTIAMPDLGLSEKTFSAVCDPLRKTVILADANADESRLVAMRRDSKTVAWSTARGSMHFCHGLAILPVQNLVLASSYYGNCVQAYQTSDGSKCGEIGVFEPTFLAADPGSATIFAATFKEGCGSVAAFQWRGTTGLTPLHATVEAAGVTPARRPLALMPPTHGPGSSAGRAFLVVGTQKSSELRVLALPALTLVHTHVLPGVQVQGLGADSARYAAGGVGSGGDEEAPATPALIVLDSASGDVLVLPWPLPGMPLLDY